MSFPLFAKRTNRRESAGTEGPIGPTGPAVVRADTGDCVFAGDGTDRMPRFESLVGNA